MPTDLPNLIRILANIKDREEQENIIFQHPFLLDASVDELLNGSLISFSTNERESVNTFLKDLHIIRETLETGQRKYIIGPGPIEHLWERQQSDEIQESYGEVLAQDPEFTSLLSPIYVRTLCSFTSSLATHGNWRYAIQIQRLLLAAINTTTISPALKALKGDVALCWIKLVAQALCDVPNGRLYHSAYTIGKQMITQAKEADNQVLLGETFHWLGVLHLDPYATNLSPDAYEYGWINWMQRLANEHGEGINEYLTEDLQVPSHDVAIQIAEDCFRQAANYREGHLKGLSLKALIQVLKWKEILKQSVDEQELTNLCREAFNLLDPNRDLAPWLTVIGILGQADSVDLAEIRKLWKTPIKEYISTKGSLGAIGMVLLTTEILQKQSVFHALLKLQSARALFDEFGNESLRRTRYNKLIILICDILGFKSPSNLPKAGMRSAVKRIRIRAQKEQWTKTKLATSLISLATASSNRNEETIGLELLDEAIQIAPLLAEDYDDALLYLRGMLLMNLGVNAINSSQWSSSVENYAQATAAFLNLKMQSAAMDCLLRIDDVVCRIGENSEVAEKVTLYLIQLALQLELEIGDPAIRAIQNLCRHTIVVLGSQAKAVVFDALVQIAKGLRFRRILADNVRYNYLEDQSGVYLLKQIQEIELQLENLSERNYNVEETLNDDILLTAYVRPDEHQSGDTLQERLANLQHSYDMHLNKKLLANNPENERAFISLRTVQAILDNRTVLLNFYLGLSTEGEMTVYVILVTSEDFQIARILLPIPYGDFKMTISEKRVDTNIFAEFVREMREQVIADPGPRRVTRKGGELLKEGLSMYLGPLIAYLDELRELGKDHLCIVPHGPYHYYPFHLLGEPDKPLAEKWIVTYLPNIALATRQYREKGVQQQQKKVMTSIGLSFEKENSFNLTPIPQSISESYMISSIFNVDPILERQATKITVMEALQSSRFVHISTHSKHNVSAPAFQCLYLAPDDISDGRLYAYELLALDLSGVDLLTLSACETVLGRFDLSDNLRGLPSSFLIAGVSTIIGTLWSVAVQPSEFFFSAFYNDLKTSENLLQAFSVAQRMTRIHFPKYRDWGAFYMLGSW